MGTPDPYLLEYINESGPASPSELVDETGADLPYSRGYVNIRCQELEGRGFLINIGNGRYRLTDRGRDWLAGEFDASVFDDKPTA